MEGKCDACGQLNKRWVYFEEPIELESFDYKTLNEIIIPFDKAVPVNTMARKAKINLFLRTGNENNTTFWTRVKVVDVDD